MIPGDQKESFCSFCGKQFLSEAAIAYGTASTLSTYSSRPKIEVVKDANDSIYPMPHMMTIKEVANTGVLPEMAIRRLLKQRRLPAVYIGTKALINYDKLVAFLESTSEDAELGPDGKTSSF